MSNQILTIAAIVAGTVLTAVVIAVTGLPQATAEQQPHRSKEAHVYGNPKAPTTIVEWSDAQCPFCQQLHPTLKQIVDESDGQINWEYRHYPLPNHPLADDAAYALECVAEAAGNDAFWTLLDTFFAESTTLSESFIISEATVSGITEEELASCVARDDIQALVTQDMAVANSYGGGSTPFNLIVFPDNTIRPVTGALPYELWQEELVQ